MRHSLCWHDSHNHSAPPLHLAGWGGGNIGVKVLKRGRPMTPKAEELTRVQPTADLLRELVAHLRLNRTQLREEWVRRIAESRLLTAMTKEEIFAEATSVFDNYVEVLETGSED